MIYCTAVYSRLAECCECFPGNLIPVHFSPLEGRPPSTEHHFMMMPMIKMKMKMMMMMMMTMMMTMMMMVMMR